MAIWKWVWGQLRTGSRCVSAPAARNRHHRRRWPSGRKRGRRIGWGLCVQARWAGTTSRIWLGSLEAAWSDRGSSDTNASTVKRTSENATTTKTEAMTLRFVLNPRPRPTRPTPAQDHLKTHPRLVQMQLPPRGHNRKWSSLLLLDVLANLAHVLSMRARWRELAWAFCRLAVTWGAQHLWHHLRRHWRLEAVCL